MAFLAHLSMKPETNALKAAVIKTAAPIKERISFCYYRLAKGISGILSYAKEGIRLWFKTKRPANRQLCLKLTVWIEKKQFSPKPGSSGAYKSASNHRTAILKFSKSRQIGTWGRYVHFGITVCGNSSGVSFPTVLPLYFPLPFRSPSHGLFHAFPGLKFYFLSGFLKFFIFFQITCCNFQDSLL